MSFPGRSSNPGYKECNVRSDSDSEEDVMLAFAACVIAWYRMRCNIYEESMDDSMFSGMMRVKDWWMEILGC